MAEEQPSQEKTEEPTARKQARAREEGQVARSRELNSMALVVTGALALLGFAPWIAGRILELTARVFASAGSADVSMLNQLGNVTWESMWTMVPMLLFMMLAGIVSTVAVGGFVLSPKALAFKGNRLSPMQGFKRMFSQRSLVELAKSIAKFVLVAGVAIATLSVLLDDLLQIGSLPIASAIAEGLRIVGTALLLIGSSLVVVALIDVPFQIAQHNKQQRMTRQEVKDELKDTEGKPEVKSRLRQLQQEVSRRRMFDEIPSADVVITNPEHFSVAIRYRSGEAAAPVVVAKGADYLAFRIRDVAREHEVPMLQVPALTRAVYFSTEIGEEVPSGLYVAVAQVLAYIFQLRQHQRGRAGRPAPIGELEIPDEYYVEGTDE